MSLERIRILVVDDHPAVREGLAELISAQADMALVGAARDGLEAVALFGRLQPDVTIMDLRLPGLSGLEAIQAIRRNSTRGKFIAMTSFQDEQGVAQAKHAGADAYLLKELFGEELLATIRAVHCGLNDSFTPNQS